MFDALIAALLAPASRLLDARDQTYWFGYVGAAAIAAAFYFWSRRDRARLRGIARYLLPPRLLKHRSTRLDLKLYLLSSIWLSLQGATVFGTLAGLDALLPHAAATARPLPAWAIVALPLVVYLSIELGYWLSHWFMHRVGWMWEIHKVHHSAEVLTPLTEWRQHPLELFWVPFVIGVTSSLTLAGLRLAFGADIRFGSLWTPGLILLAFIVTVVHLRHSHVRLRTSGVWARVLHSPAHHQVHHSTDPRHFQKNLGFCLSVWDWLFGTLYVPRDESLRYGIVDAAGRRDALMDSTSVATHIVLPLRRAGDPSLRSG